MAFSDLGLSGKVLQAVESSGYTQPTPIQAEAIPHVLARRDVLGIAQTGTGKTAAFTLPMLTLLETGRARARMPRTLILEPTRELAAQVEESFIKYGVHHKLNVALLIGGVSFADQDAKITRGVDVLIATPGRLLDHFERGKLLLSGIEVLVIDEADRMLDMGFIPDIERICKMVPFTRQTLFFSATMPPEIQNLVDNFLSNPARIEVARASSTANTITQLAVASGSEASQKRKTLRRLIRDADELKNGIIFCNRKRDVAVVQRSLEKHGFSVVALHGDMDQRSRMQALDRFRNNDVQLLVASDVAARGLDIPDVSHVFNYDTPHHAEDYVHRIGRTGRAGRKGTAYTIITPDDSKSAAAIVAMTGKDFEWLGPSLEESGVAAGDDGASRDRRHDRRRGKDGKDNRRGRDSRRQESGEADEAQAARPLEARQAEQRQQEPRPQEARPHEPRQDSRRDHRGEPRHDARNGGRNGQRDDRRGRGRQERDEPSPPGFGEHIPAFMLVKAAPKRRAGKQAETPAVETRRDAGPVTPVAITPVNETPAVTTAAPEGSRVQDGAPETSPERGERKKRDRRRRGRRETTPAVDATTADTAVDTTDDVIESAAPVQTPAATPETIAAPAEAAASDVAADAATAPDTAPDNAGAAKAVAEKPKRKRAARKTAGENAVAVSEPEAAPARPARSRSRKVAAATPEATPAIAAADEPAPAVEEKPAVKKRAPRKTAAEKPATGGDAAGEPAATKDAAEKTPARKKTAPRKKAAAETDAIEAPVAAAAAQPAAEAEPVKAPRPARTRTRRSARTTRGAENPAGEETDA